MIGNSLMDFNFVRNCMKSLLRVGLMAWCVLGLLGGTAFAETMYAKKSGVKVTEAKSPTSKVIAMLKTGDSVTVLDKAGRQYQVKLSNGKKGWVFKFKLSEKKPSRSTGGRSGLSALTGKTKIAAKESRAGGSIRGLKESTEQYAERKHISPAYRRAVDKMEELTISDEELQRFQQEGNVGEYAGGAQ
jgi:hypothetical protein